MTIRSMEPSRLRLSSVPPSPTNLVSSFVIANALFTVDALLREFNFLVNSSAIVISRSVRFMVTFFQRVYLVGSVGNT